MKTACKSQHDTNTKEQRQKNILKLFLTLKMSWSYDNTEVVVGETKSSQTQCHLFVIPDQLRCSSKQKCSPHTHTSLL